MVKQTIQIFCRLKPTKAKKAVKLISITIHLKLEQDLKINIYFSQKAL